MELALVAVIAALYVVGMRKDAGPPAATSFKVEITPTPPPARPRDGFAKAVQLAVVLLLLLLVLGMVGLGR